ncbi:MAG: hypothetical protein IPJ19_15610 [Planctomycetes bacterium]|nr:hypothetical protein [Planctomycetota bacterium]
MDVQVLDDTDQPLPNSAVTAQWSRADQWNRTDWQTDASGHAHLRRLPTGEVYIRVRHPGFVPVLKQLFRSEEWVHVPVRVAMEKAATIEGSCLRDGTPVPDFSVYFFSRSPADGGRVDIEGSADGTFRIDEAKPGLITVFATSQDTIQSAHVSVSVEPGATGHASVTLPAPRRVAGTIVDALSGEAVPSAKVAAMLISGRGVIKPWKAASVVDEQGHFELSGFGSVEGRIEVFADGFAPRQVSVWAGRTSFSISATWPCIGLKPHRPPEGRGLGGPVAVCGDT